MHPVLTGCSLLSRILTGIKFPTLEDPFVDDESITKMFMEQLENERSKNVKPMNIVATTGELRKEFQSQVWHDLEPAPTFEAPSLAQWNEDLPSSD